VGDEDGGGVGDSVRNGCEERGKLVKMSGIEGSEGELGEGDVETCESDSCDGGWWNGCRRERVIATRSNAITIKL
jgi:hypothetical protein